MSNLAKSIITRIIVGLAIAVTMFYFRSAHAQTCPTGQVSKYTVSEVGGTASNCPVRCTVGQTFSAVSDDMCTSQGAICGNTDFKWGPVISRSETRIIRSVLNASGVYINEGGHLMQVACTAPPPPPACPTTTRYLYFDGVPPAESCEDLCGFTRSQEPGDKFEFLSPVSAVTTAAALYKGTGTACSGSVAMPAPKPAAPIPTVAGPVVPAPPAPGNRKGAATLNGEQVNLAEPSGTGKCTRLNNGAGFCVTSSDPTKISDAKPDNGTPGTLATGGDKLDVTTVAPAPSGTGTVTTTNNTTIYNAATLNGASNQKPTPQGATCGGTGQPPCSTKIDEAGTATDGKPMADPDLEKGRSEATAIASGVAGWSLPGTGTFSSQSCRSISLAPPPGLANMLNLDFGSTAMELPGPNFCPQIDTIKNVAGWGMALFVFWAASFAVLRNSANPSGSKLASIDD